MKRQEEVEQRRKLEEEARKKKLQQAVRLMVGCIEALQSDVFKQRCSAAAKSRISLYFGV